jgi:hypothetical protein
MTSIFKYVCVCGGGGGSRKLSSSITIIFLFLFSVTKLSSSNYVASKLFLEVPASVLGPEADFPD